jgi:hypothetical protein
MTTIQPPGWGNKPWNYEPPDLPETTPQSSSPPVYQEMRDGTVRRVDVIIVTAQKKQDPYRSLMPYSGLTGAQENARRDMEWAMSSPEQRAIMMGMDPFASIDGGRNGEPGFTTLELPETFYNEDGWGFNLVGGDKGREIAGSIVGNIRFDGRGSQLDQDERKKAGLPERTTWSPELITPEYLASLGTKPRGNNFNVREIGGDELDLMALGYDIMKAAGYRRRWRSDSEGWQHFKNGNVSVFTGNNGFKLTLRVGSGTSSTPAIDVSWNGYQIKLHSTENNQSVKGPR